MPSPNRRGSPRQPPSTCARVKRRCTASRPRRVSEPSMMSSCTSANVCTQLERGAGVDHGRVVGRAAGADERAVAERGPQPLAAREHEIAQRAERRLEARVDGRPARDLGREHRVDARLGALRDVGERGREDRADGARTHCGQGTSPAARDDHRSAPRTLPAVLRFLSAEWLRAFDAALRADRRARCPVRRRARSRSRRRSRPRRGAGALRRRARRRRWPGRDAEPRVPGAT